MNLTFLGCKGWCSVLDDRSTVFAELWDSYKFPASDSEHKANVYAHLRDFWGTVVPDFIELNEWGFWHILLLSYFEVSPICYIAHRVSPHCDVTENRLQHHQSVQRDQCTRCISRRCST